MALRYIKRAFNRLFVVVSLAWVAYCTVIYPYGEQGKAFTRYLQNERDCYQFKLGQGKERLDDCLKKAEKGWHRAQDRWALRNFYVALGPWKLAAVIGLPLLVYGVLRGIAAVPLWIWRGYRTREVLRKSEIHDSRIKKNSDEWQAVGSQETPPTRIASKTSNRDSTYR